MTMRSALPALFLLLAACGGSSPPPQGPAPDGPDDGVVETGEGTAAASTIDADQVCGKIESLRAGGCAYLAEQTDFDLEGCKAELRDAGDDPVTVAVSACFAESADCAGSEACVNEVIAAELEKMDSEGGVEGGVASCDRSQPYGAAAKRFSEIPTSMEKPIEVCGWPGQTDWLRATKCNDGSNPFKDQDHAHEARLGSMGAGGRCGQMIDLYEVSCPEGKYEVYMDMYACGG